MSLIRALAILPFLGILGGTPFLNRAEPQILGLPLLFAWLLLWIVLTSVIMLVIYLCDPTNRAQPPTMEPGAGPGAAASRHGAGASAPGESRRDGTNRDGANRDGANRDGTNRGGTKR